MRMRVGGLRGLMIAVCLVASGCGEQMANEGKDSQVMDTAGVVAAAQNAQTVYASAMGAPANAQELLAAVAVEPALSKLGQEVKTKRYQPVTAKEPEVVDIQADRAEVETCWRADGKPLGRSFTMTKENGGWKVSEASTEKQTSISCS